MSSFGRRGTGLYPILHVALAFAGALLLGGCNIFGSGEPKVDVQRPLTLNPESDLFVSGALRQFSVTEGIIRAGKDTTFTVRSLEILHTGDTVIGGAALKRVLFAAEPAPVSAFTQLGLNAARLYYDTLAISDPGAGIRFPDTPFVGWRLDTTVGELRTVRRLTKLETIRAASLNQRCWVFVDSVYWNDAPVSKGTYWMGATGLVKLRLEWDSFSPAAITGGIFWRELKASN